MSGFRFSLDPLLRQRELHEQQKQRDVAALDRRRMDLEARLRSDQQAIEAGKGDLRSQLVGKLNGDELRGQAAMTMQIMRDAHRLVLELAGMHRQLEQARSELQQASAQRRALELLRERRFAAWKQRQDRAEQSATDDLVAARSTHGDMP